MPTNVLIAGFQHATNTFAPTQTDWATFTSGACFPPLRRGAAALVASRGCQLPIGGFIDRGGALGWRLNASVWAGANPSTHVTEGAFERIRAMLLADADAAVAAVPTQCPRRAGAWPVR